MCFVVFVVFREAGRGEDGQPYKDNSDVFAERKDPNVLKVWTCYVIKFQFRIEVIYLCVLMCGILGLNGSNRLHVLFYCY